MTDEHSVNITPQGVARLNLGHLWIYRSDVSGNATTPPGQIVKVLTQKGRYLGRAFYSSLSQITLRLLTREDRPIDRAFWEERIAGCRAWRERLFPNQETYRLLFSDSDLCSSIIVDRYGEFLSLQ